MKTIKGLFERRPRVMAWLVLAVAMLVIFLVASRGVALEPLQRVALAGVVVLLAGACVWIIYWE